MKTAIFQVVVPYGLVEVYRRIRDACYLRHQGDNASTSETSENFYQTIRRNNPEDSCLHTRHRENFKSL
jgi:hypothetical protein